MSNQFKGKSKEQVYICNIQKEQEQVYVYMYIDIQRYVCVYKEHCVCIKNIEINVQMEDKAGSTAGEKSKFSL